MHNGNPTVYDFTQPTKIGEEKSGQSSIEVYELDGVVHITIRKDDD